MEFYTPDGAMFYDIRLADFRNPKARAHWWQHLGRKTGWRGILPVAKRIARQYLAEAGK